MLAHSPSLSRLLTNLVLAWFKLFTTSTRFQLLPYGDVALIYKNKFDPLQEIKTNEDLNKVLSFIRIYDLCQH